MAEQGQATPSELRYSEIPAMSSPSAAMTCVKLIPSTGTTYSGNGNIRIPLAIPTDSFADMRRAYLRYTIVNKTTTGHNKQLYIDPQAGAASVIQRFQVVSGLGGILTETNSYPNYCAVLNTYMNPDYVSSTMSITEGCSNNPQTHQGIGGTGVAETTGADLSGQLFVPENGSLTLTHRPKDPLFNCDKIIGWGFLQGVSYLNINLASTTAAFRMDTSGSGTPVWEIKDVELHVPVITLPADFNASFRSLMASGIPVSMHSVGVVNSQQNVEANSNVTTSTFACRKRNVKGLVLTAREQNNLEDAYADTPSCRRSLATTEYNFQIGGVRMPSSRFSVSKTNQGQLLMETKKCLGHLSPLHGLCATRDNYYIFDEHANRTKCQKSVFALDTQPYLDNEQISGINLSAQGLPIVFEATMDATKGSQNGKNILLDLYAIFSIVFSIDGISGGISSSS